MNDHELTIEELLAQLEEDNQIRDHEVKEIIDRLDHPEGEPEDPVHLRILAGIGGWFAAWCLIGALGSLFALFEHWTWPIICGLPMLVGAVWTARETSGTFLSQFLLAVAIAGSGAIVAGVVLLIRGFDFHSTLPAVFFSHAVVMCAVYPFYEDSAYRFLSPLCLGIIALMWVEEYQAEFYVNLLFSVTFLVAGALLLQKKRIPMLTPMAYAATLLLPCLLLFMTIFNMEQWDAKEVQPWWPTKAVLVVGLIYLYWHLAGGLKRASEPWMILAVVATVVLGIFTDPGILLAVGFLVLGYANGDIVLTGLAALILPVFLVLFYYNLQVDLIYKSWVIAGSGAVLLICRWIAGALQPQGVSQ